MTAIREQATALYETARSLALVHIAAAGHTVAAWAESRDVDPDWQDIEPVWSGRDT